MQGTQPYSLDDLSLWLAKASLEGVPVAELFAGCMRQMNALGYGIGRGYIGTRLLNPLVRAEAYIYERKSDSIQREAYEHTAMPEEFQRSPINHMITRNELQLYRVLQGPDAQLDFQVLEDFAARGFTAWAARLIPFTILPAAPQPEDPLGFVITLCCDLEGGWSADQRAAFERLLPYLSAAIQGRVFATLARDLLTTYLGTNTALRVLGGITTRGDLTKLRAAILYADFRGFTARAGALDPASLLGLLDRQFDVLVAPIERAGGEVLKFMGDGLLAVFPSADGGDAAAARAALEAASQALAAVDALRRDEPHVMSLDIALHLGDVLYGNVGGAARLDFTVIGPAVNAAARIERKCEELDAALLISRIWHANCAVPVSRLLGAMRCAASRRQWNCLP